MTTNHSHGVWREEEKRAETLSEELSDYETVSWVGGNKYRIESEYELLTRSNMRSIDAAGFGIVQINFDQNVVDLEHYASESDF